MTASLLLLDVLRGRISWNNTTAEMRGWRICSLVDKHKVRTHTHTHTHTHTFTLAQRRAIPQLKRAVTAGKLAGRKVNVVPGGADRNGFIGLLSHRGMHTHTHIHTYTPTSQTVDCMSAPTKCGPLFLVLLIDRKLTFQAVIPPGAL